MHIVFVQYTTVYNIWCQIQSRARVAQNVVGLPNNSYKPIANTTWIRAQLCKLQKRVHSQPQVIKFTSSLLMVSGFVRVLRLFPPLKLVAMISYSWNIAESGIKHQKSNQIKSKTVEPWPVMYTVLLRYA